MLFELIRGENKVEQMILPPPSPPIAIKVKTIHWTTLVKKYLNDAVFPVTFQHFVKRQTVNHYLSLRTNLIILSLAFFYLPFDCPMAIFGSSRDQQDMKEFSGMK